MTSGCRTVLREFALLCAAVAISQTTGELKKDAELTGNVRGPDGVSGSASGVLDLMVSSQSYNLCIRRSM